MFKYQIKWSSYRVRCEFQLKRRQTTALYLGKPLKWDQRLRFLWPISSSLIGPQKYNASKFVLNQKQERKWALELDGLMGSPTRLVNFRSHQASGRTDFACFICLLDRLSAPGSPRMTPCKISLISVSRCLLYL